MPKKPQRLLPFRDRPDPCAGLRSALNLGPKTSQWLVDAGVDSLEKVRQLGPVEVCRLLRVSGRPVSVLMAYALEGALSGCHWTAISWEVRESLRVEFAKMKKSPTNPAPNAAVGRSSPPRSTSLSGKNETLSEIRLSDIEECEARLRQAQLDGDVTALDQLLDEALVFTTLDGSVVGKSDDLALHRSRRLRISKMEPTDFRILDLEKVAVVSVEMDAEAVYDGVRSGGRLRYTRVWAQRPDGWRVVAGHMSAVADQS
jgi:hypothetical protein